MTGWAEYQRRINREIRREKIMSAIGLSVEALAILAVIYLFIIIFFAL